METGPKNPETCLKLERTAPPIWIMGLSNSSFGLYGGLAFFAIPQLLAAQHVSEARIAGITAAALSPNFWAVVFGPMLDVRFSRRWYATLFAALASLLAVIAILNLHHLVVLEIALVTGSATAILSTTALGGWLSTVVRKEDENKLSAWYNFAYIAAMGLGMVVAGELVRNLPLWLAAGLVGATIFLPTTIFLFMPAPGPDRRLAGESFAQFSREILMLLRRREVLITLLLFLAPCGSFALTNMLGGLGNDFSASPRMVSLAGGLGAIVPGMVGSLLFPLLAKRMPLRLLPGQRDTGRPVHIEPVGAASRSVDLRGCSSGRISVSGDLVYGHRWLRSRPSDRIIRWPPPRLPFLSPPPTFPWRTCCASTGGLTPLAGCAAASQPMRLQHCDMRVDRVAPVPASRRSF